MSIRRYLATLTPEQEARVLTQAFEPVCGGARRVIGLYPWNATGSCRCLVMTADDQRVWGTEDELTEDAGMDYEDACVRFGVERVNAAIRNRILSNQARRALTGRSEAVTA